MPVLDLNGNYSHSLDPKGRVTIPSAFREAFDRPFTIGFNNDFSAIAFYPAEKWADKCAELERINESDKGGMDYVRLIRAFSFANQTADAQGRVLLPASLRQQTGIEKAVVLVGMGSYIELWDEARFIERFASARASVSELLDHVLNSYFK